MRRSRGVPGELRPCALGTRACGGERIRVREESPQRARHRLDVAGGDDRACAEPADDLPEATDVVDDGRDARSQSLEQCPRDVDLGAVWKEGNGRLRQRAAQLRVREVTEPPLGAIAGARAELVERDSRIAGDEEPRVVHAEHRLHRILRPLVRPDEAEAERRSPVVAAIDVRAEDRMPDDVELRLRHPEIAELAVPSLRVDDDPLEPAEQRSPQPDLGRRPPRDDVVRSEDRGAARTEEPAVELRRAEPLDVDHVGLRGGKARHSQWVLERLDGDARPVAAHARRERVEPLGGGVSHRWGDGAEPEARCDELDVGARPRERGGEPAVVGRRVRGRVGDDDAHRRQR